jgi:D-arabinose 1-dehydrogenase-like Zn-dependent alcohol dehydrogenase
MKAAIVPSANSKWEVRETNIPEPGENQVLIKIRASGMCYTDVHQTRGQLPGDFPRTLGHEPVGEIVAVGGRCHGAQDGRSRRCALGATHSRTLRMVCAQQTDVL